MLDAMFRIQQVFSRKVSMERRGKPLESLSPAERRDFTRDIALALHAEVSELLEEMPGWRMHRESSRDALRANVLFECVDVWKYLLNVLLAWGVSPEEFLAAFEAKSGVVEARWEQERALLRIAAEGRPVAAFDLDGVLAEYPGPWLRFLEVQLGNRYASVDDAKDLLPPDEYEDLKTSYRASGLKRTAPGPALGSTAVPGAFRDAGWGVVILSARPAWKVGRVHSDTLGWLEDHGVPYDALLFDEDKGVKAARSIPNLRFMAEDDPGHAREVARLGVKVYLLGGAAPPRALAGRIVPVGGLPAIAAAELP